MAQHSHSVYGNLYPHHNYYQKKKQSNHNHNITNNNASHSNHLRSVDPKPNELSPAQKKLFKSTDVLYRGRLPFSNRNGKLHRSNPHLHFGGLGLSLSSDSNSQNSSASGGSSVSKPSSTPYFTKTPSKWRSEISNAAHLLPRKWCDFVFRRNVDNKLYRSESFRFIQKTNSLLLLPPLSGGGNKYRNKHPQVPVSDYVDPLDHIIGTSPSSQGWNNKSTSEKPVQNDEDVGYNEIISPYNAPYYYSDTIKEPTYCSPCPDWRQSCGAINIPETLDKNTGVPEQSSSEKSQNCQQHRCPSRESTETPSAQKSGVPMARKRYETAFLPSNSQHPSQSSSPDVDCLLLVIESSCSLTGDCRAGEGNAHHEGNRVQRTDGREVIDTSRLEPDPSISYCQPMNHSHAITHTSGSTTTTSSPLLSDKKPKPTMPLSEPLPQKKYSNIINCSSSCSSSSPSTSTSLTSCRPPDKRLLMTMMKDNSVSSLESIDSTKSEDLHSFSRQFGGHRGGSHYGRGANCKLLSPISDKSPLEPISMLQSSVGGNDSHNLASHHHSHERPWHNHIINTADLINVPWDMPKIKRRLALLADSGISLDCTGNTHGDSGQFSSDERRSFDDSNFQYTASHINHHITDSRVGGGGGDSLDKIHGESGRSKGHSLQLNLDNGLVRDEYYEDPRLNVTEQSQPELPPCPPPKPKFPWLTTNVTSVQVHVPGAVERPRKPDKCRMTLDFGLMGNIPSNRYEVDPSIELEAQEWFHGAITRCEAEAILRATKEGSFLVRNCESSSFNRYSLSLKSARGYIHVRIEPNSLGTFSLGEHEFPSVSHLVLHFMYHRLPIKGAEHVKLLYPVITQLL